MVTVGVALRSQLECRCRMEPPDPNPRAPSAPRPLNHPPHHCPPPSASMTPTQPVGGYHKIVHPPVGWLLATATTSWAPGTHSESSGAILEDLFLHNFFSTIRPSSIVLHSPAYIWLVPSFSSTHFTTNFVCNLLIFALTVHPPPPPTSLSQTQTYHLPRQLLPLPHPRSPSQRLPQPH